MEPQPTVSAIIVTYNRPTLLPRAIQSVLDQTYQDFELIVVDNDAQHPARAIVESFQDDRIRYVCSPTNRDCAGGKNIGIEHAKGQFVAFLDDDDVWLPEKLQIQMDAFSAAPDDVGFCFTALTAEYDDHEVTTTVPNGIANYYERALRSFNGFLASSLVIRKNVFETVGIFSESFPSHTDIDLIIRMAKEYRGISINKPLIRMTMKSGHQQMGKNFQRRIAGREMLLKKYADAFAAYPIYLAKHLFKLATFYRAERQYRDARRTFRRAWGHHFRFHYFLHYVSMLGNGIPYRIIQVFKGRV